MILTKSQLTEIFLAPTSQALLSKARLYSSKLRMHITGQGLDTAIQQMIYLEQDGIFQIRQQYAQSNKDVFARLHRPMDKIFSAKGGGVNYNLPEQLTKKFKAYLGSVEYGLTLRKWIETFWLTAYVCDPMGVLLMEIDSQSAAGTAFAYPTYKSTVDIHDYKLNGRNLDYLILKTSEKSKDGIPYYRVIDDQFDYLVEWDGTKVKEVRNGKLPNYFMKVPATVVSDIYSPYYGMYISPDDAVIELADAYLREGSVFNVFKARHGYPKEWRYPAPCDTCKGTKQYQGEDCRACNASGIKTNYDVAKVTIIPVPEGNQPILAPDVMGYVSPPIDTWTKMEDSLKGLFDLMHHTMWGTTIKEDVSNETATGRFIDVQPVNERLNKFSEAAEGIERFITDLSGQFYFNTTYTRADIVYGRRYLIETPDEIWKKYQEARTAGAPEATLNNLLEEFYQSKYQGDSTELQKYLRMMRVEPWVHLTISQAKSILPPTVYAEKLYFPQWLATLTSAQWLQSEADLRAALKAHVKEQEPIAEEPKERNKQEVFN